MPPSSLTYLLPPPALPFHRPSSPSRSPPSRAPPRASLPRLPSRRRLLLLSLALLPAPPPSLASPSLPPAPTSRPARSASSLLRDTVYPARFRGTWAAASVCAGVEAPAGEAAFGGKAKLRRAREGVGEVLEYAVRFVAGEGGAVADRRFNVERIAEAAMGGASVLECEVAGFNFVRVGLRLRQAGGGVFVVAMESLGREGRGEQEDGFFASEMVRQSVRAGGDGDRGSGGKAQVADVLTECFYEIVGEDRIVARQRTSVFAGRGDAREREARGRPVDVREYDVTFTRRR